MEEKMFCFQCEQTAGCSGCRGARGVCGKQDTTAKLQDELTGALIGLAHAVGEDKAELETDRLMMESLFATLTNVNFDDESLKKQIEAVHQEKRKYVPGCISCQEPCGRTTDYSMKKLWEDEEDIRSLKSRSAFRAEGVQRLMPVTPWFWDIRMNRSMTFFIKEWQLW